MNTEKTNKKLLTFEQAVQLMEEGKSIINLEDTNKNHFFYFLHDSCFKLALADADKSITVTNVCIDDLKPLEPFIEVTDDDIDDLSTDSATMAMKLRLFTLKHAELPSAGAEVKPNPLSLLTENKLDDSTLGNYVGVKAVKAIQMTLYEFISLTKITPSYKTDHSTDGRLVEGYLVAYIDGGKPNTRLSPYYLSWSPKDVFEKAYILTKDIPSEINQYILSKGVHTSFVEEEISLLNKDQALDALKSGEFVIGVEDDFRYGLFLYMDNGSLHYLRIPDPRYDQTPQNKLLDGVFGTVFSVSAEDYLDDYTDFITVTRQQFHNELSVRFINDKYKIHALLLLYDQIKQNIKSKKEGEKHE